MKNKNIIKEISKNSFKKKLKKAKKDISLLNNRYFLEEEVGIGGLSIVYKASDIYSKYFNEESNIVIKIPTKELLEKTDIAAFVYAEYVFLKKLNNDYIVKVLDFGIDKKSNIPYIVLEYIEGKLLSEYSIAQMDMIFKNTIFKILHQSLNYIHSKNIVHADITPNNILVKDKKVIIFDFGISQNIINDKNFTLEYKKIKAFNPKYCAPEVLEGEKPTIESDIFSFACVMYEIYTCSSLFNENSLELKKNINKNINLNKIPFLLKNWFKNALNTNPKKRSMDIYMLSLVKSYNF